MSTASGPSLRSVRSISLGRSSVRSMASSSAGGPVRSPSPAPSRTANSTPATAIRRRGTSPSSHVGAPPNPLRVAARASTSHHLEEAGPAQLGELAHVGVEHVLAGIWKPQLEDAALAL